MCPKDEANVRARLLIVRVERYRKARENAGTIHLLMA
jgi:hypothetical protein